MKNKMMPTEEKIRSLCDKDLMDIVKNYRQYKFDDSLRLLAIQILEERGLDQAFLRATGHYESKIYQTALQYYKTCEGNARLAFLFYIVNTLTWITLIFLLTHPAALAGVLIFYLSLLLYLIFFIKSLLDQHRFFKSIGKDLSLGGLWIFLLLGAPFYFASYFYYKQRLKNELEKIR